MLPQINTTTLSELDTSRPSGETLSSLVGFIVLNPVAGEGNPEQTKEILRSALGEDHYDLYETTGEETLSDVVQTAVTENDYGWVAAVGGDGTVSQVANGLLHSQVPLLIIPGGTANALAQELGIPLEIKAACELLSKEPHFREIDGIQVGDRIFFLQMGIGIEAKTMQNTPSSQKSRWGPVAYLWTAVQEAFGWQSHHFKLIVDGQSYDVDASELVIANASEIGVFGLEWADMISPDDGCLDIAVVQVRSLTDYARLLWALLSGKQRHSVHIQFYQAHKEIRLQAERPLPIHGDGELLDMGLPLTAVVVPGAVKIMVAQKE